jgi:hypothetical protein
MGRNIDRRFNGGIAGFRAMLTTLSKWAKIPTPVFRVRDLGLASEAERARLERRYGMLNDLEAYQKNVESSAQAVKARDTFYEKAHGIITSPAAKKALTSTPIGKGSRAHGRNQLASRASSLVARSKQACSSSPLPTAAGTRTSITSGA